MGEGRLVRARPSSGAGNSVEVLFAGESPGEGLEARSRTSAPRGHVPSSGRPGLAFGAPAALLLWATVAIAVAVALASAPPAPAQRIGCGSSDYAYAGVQTHGAVYYAGATIRSLAAPQVKKGHVAGWVAIVAKDARAWLQIGLSALPGDRSNQVYLEYAPPGRDPRYVRLRGSVPVGEASRVAVKEIAGRRSWWQAWLDGSPVGQPVYLAGSHGRWGAQVMGESWNDNSGACNRYAYAFHRVSLAQAPGRLTGRPVGLRSTSDAGYSLVWSSPSDFVVSALDRD
jgi:hypothetical protein